MVADTEESRWHRCEAEGGRLLLGSPGPLGVAPGASCGASVDGRSSLRMPTQSHAGQEEGRGGGHRPVLSAHRESSRAGGLWSAYCCD